MAAFRSNGTRRPSIVAVVVVVAVAACGSGDGDGGAGRAGPPDPPDRGPAATAPPDGTGDPAGLVVVVSTDERDIDAAPQLEVVDPATGEVTATVGFATDGWVPGAGVELRSSYSADWRYVALTMAGDEADEVRVLRLNDAGTAYEEQFAITGSPTAPAEYRNPRFGPDGHTLWMEARAPGADVHTVVATDLADHRPGDAPEPTGVAFARREAYDGISGARIRDAWTVATGRPEPLLRDAAREATPPGADGPAARYWTDGGGAVVAAEFDDGCTEVGREDGGAFLVADCGGVALARIAVDAEAGTLTATEVLPDPHPAASDAETVVVTPDGTEALVRAGGTWFRAALDRPGEEPRTIDSLEIDLFGIDANTRAILGWR